MHPYEIKIPINVHYRLCATEIIAVKYGIVLMRDIYLREV